MALVFVTGGSGFVGRNLLPALIQAGYQVRALARSEQAATKLRELGATVSPGDLDDRATLTRAMAGCELVFHVAAAVDGDYATQYQANVIGTENMLAAAKTAGVKRFIHVSTEAVLFGKDTPRLVNADETWRLPSQPVAAYPATKGLAEQRVLAANSPDFATIIVRPRMVWGKDDTTLLALLVETVKKGSFMWIGGGKHLVSTTHITNVVEGLLKAAERGRGGEIYFITDGSTVSFRQFVTELLATQNVDPGQRSIPYWLALSIARITQVIWKVSGRKDAPTINPFAVRLIGEEATVNDSKARRELGYQALVTREQGLAELRELIH